MYLLRRDFRSFLRHSKIGIQNLKWVGLSISLLCGGWGCGAGAATKENPTDRVSIGGGATLSRPFRRNSAGSARAGYIEGQNLAIEYRYVEGNHDRALSLLPS